MQITPGTDSAHKTSVAFARIDADGHANYEFDLNWAVPQLPDLEPFGHLHTGSIAATVEPGGSTVVVAAERMRLLGTVSYDPNIRPALMHSPDTVVDRVEHLVSLSDVVKTSDEDLDWLYPGVSVENIMRRWVKTGPAMVVVTRGSWGAYARLAHNRDMLHIDQTPVTVGDTIGAGDSFMAGLLSGLLDAGLLGSPQARDRLAAVDWPDVQPALLRAIHTSAMTVSRSGAYAPPGRKCTPFMRSTRPSPERSSRSPRTPCVVTGVDAQPHSREESPDLQRLFIRHGHTPATVRGELGTRVPGLGPQSRRSSASTELTLQVESEVIAHTRNACERGAAARAQWQLAFDSWAAANRNARPSTTGSPPANCERCRPWPLRFRQELRLRVRCRFCLRRRVGY